MTRSNSNFTTDSTLENKLNRTLISDSNGKRNLKRNVNPDSNSILHLNSTLSLSSISNPIKRAIPPQYRSRALWLVSLLCLASISWGATFDDCAGKVKSPFGGQMLIFGDSNAVALQKHILNDWVQGPRPKALSENDLFGALPSHPNPLVTQFHPLGFYAIGMIHPFKEYAKYIVHTKVLNRDYSEERAPQVLAEEVEKRHLTVGDILIFWMGANDNQDFVFNNKRIPRQTHEWWHHYYQQVESVITTCQLKQLDCYWIGPARYAKGASLKKMAETLDTYLMNRLSTEPIHYLSLFQNPAFYHQAFTADGVHLLLNKERLLLRTLNDLIRQNRGFDLAANLSFMKTCVRP